MFLCWNTPKSISSFNPRTVSESLSLISSVTYIAIVSLHCKSLLEFPLSDFILHYNKLRVNVFVILAQKLIYISDLSFIFHFFIRNFFLFYVIFLSVITFYFFFILSLFFLSFPKSFFMALFPSFYYSSNFHCLLGSLVFYIIFFL